MCGKVFNEGMTTAQCEAITAYRKQCIRPATADVQGRHLCGFHHRVAVTGSSRKATLVDHGDHAGPESGCHLCRVW